MKASFGKMAQSQALDYLRMSYSEETRHVDFYTYANVRDLAVKCENEMQNVDIVRCRTIGILLSEYGKFYLCDMGVSGVQLEYRIQISTAYLKSPVQSTIIPYPVQIFGTLQWKKRPVIFAKVLQVLTIPIAIRIRDIMSNIVGAHLATSQREQTEEIDMNT